MAEFKRYISLVFKAGIEHWDKGEFVVTLIFLIIPPVVSVLLGLSFKFTGHQLLLAIIGAFLFDVIIIIPTKIGLRYIRLITPKLRIELAASPEVNNEHIWWHLIVHNDMVAPIEDCYGQIVSFTPNKCGRLYDAIRLPWSSLGARNMELNTIPGKSFKYLDLVMTNRKDLYVLTITNVPNAPILRGTPYPEPPGTYDITVQVGSNKQGFMPSKINLQATLEHNGELKVSSAKL